MVARSLQRLRKPDIHDARLHHRIAIANVDFENAFHPRHHDHHAAAHRQASAGKTGPSPARQEDDVMPPTDLDDLDDFAGRFRKYHDIRRVLFDDKAIALVRRHLGQRR